MMLTKNNMVEYAREYIAPMRQESFTEVDSLVLSWLSNLRFPAEFSGIFTDRGMRLCELNCAEYYGKLSKGVAKPAETVRLLAAAAANPRFRNMRLFGYKEHSDTEITKQFAAVTIQVVPELYYISFRGTDCTLNGWKEDFSMALNEPVPSQIEAAAYINKAGKELHGEIMAGGHSKGGNLAVFAAAECLPEIDRKLIAVYSHDGPGFSEYVQQKIDMERISERLHKTMPQAALVGRMLEDPCDFRIVTCNVRGIRQHNPFTWRIENGKFVYENRFGASSRLTYNTLNNWLGKLNCEERKRFIETLFYLLESTGETSFMELFHDFRHNLPVILRKTGNLDEETRTFMFYAMRKLAGSGVKMLPVTVKDSFHNGS